MSPRPHTMAGSPDSAHQSSGNDEKSETAKPFRLLDLPPELWSQIGKLALDAECRVPEDAFYESTYEQQMRPPAITQTCQALRAELIMSFYGNMPPLLICGDFALGSATKWLNSVEPEIRTSKNFPLLLISQSAAWRFRGHWLQSSGWTFAFEKLPNLISDGSGNECVGVKLV